jgi:hypothetical protein
VPKVREEPQPVLEGLAVRRMQEALALRQAQGVQGAQEVRRPAPQPEAQAPQPEARAVRQPPRQPPQVFRWG